MNITFCVGISGSGKSTYSKEFIKENLNYIRINRDAIRLALIGNLNGYYQRNDLNKVENIINHIIYSILDEAFSNNYNIIIDNTNLKISYIENIIADLDSLAAEYLVINKINYKFFDIDVNEARKRVSKRENYPSHISEETDYINKQYQQYINIKKELNG